MSKASKSHKRFKLFIDRDVQGTIARRLLFHWCALAFCMFIMTAVVHVLSSPLESAEAQMNSYVQKHGQVFLVLLMLTPPFLWDSVKLSHRFAGPILRLRRAMEVTGSGEPAKHIKFRDGDFWMDLANNFNKVVDRLDAAEKKLAEFERESQPEELHDEVSV